MVPTLFGISLLMFGLTQILPGGPVEQAIAEFRMGDAKSESVPIEVTEELRQELERLYGFDKPFHERYFTWLSNLLKLDFGTSYQYQDPVVEIIVSKLPVSLTFGFFTFLLVYLISIPLGVYKATHDGSKFDSITSLLLFVSHSIPSFALAIFLIVLFCGGTFLNLFPLQGLVSENFDELSTIGKLFDYLHHIVLPLFCFVLSQFAMTTIVMKNSFLEQVKSDYVRTAIAKGLPNHKVSFKHILRNALIPIATELGEFTSIFLMGSILIEQIFGLDGIGQLNYESIISRDYPVVMAIIMIAAVAKVLGVLLSDLLYVVLDPRISFKR